MAIYFYGNYNGNYLSIGDRDSAALLAASRSVPNLLIYRTPTKNVSAWIQRHTLSMASSVYQQAAIYDKMQMDFAWTGFETEQAVLNRLSTGDTRDLPMMPAEAYTDGLNRNILQYILGELVEVDRYGGQLKPVVLNVSGQGFTQQFRTIAHLYFNSLPRTFTENTGFTAGAMQENSQGVKLLQLLPAGSAEQRAVPAAQCGAEYQTLKKDVRLLVEFWLNNPEIVKRFSDIASGVGEWKTIIRITSWMNGAFTDADIANLTDLYNSRNGMCWAGYLEEAMKNSRLQEALAAQEKVYINAQQFTSVDEIIQFVQENFGLFVGSCRSDLVTAVCNRFLAYLSDAGTPCIQAYMNIQVRQNFFINEVGEQGYFQLANALETLISRELNSSMNADFTIENLLRNAEKLKPLGIDRTQQYLAGYPDQIAQRTDPVQLLPKVKRNEQPLLDCLGQNGFQKLFAAAAQNYSTAMLLAARKASSLEEAAALCDQVQNDGCSAPSNVDIFRAAARNSDYVTLGEHKELCLRYVPIAEYQSMLGSFSDGFRNESRQKINGAVKSLEKSQESAEKTASKLNRILNSATCDQDAAELKEYIHKSLEKKLNEFERERGDRHNCFDALAELADLSAWKDQFRKKQKEQEEPDEETASGKGRVLYIVLLCLVVALAAAAGFLSFKFVSQRSSQRKLQNALETYQQSGSADLSALQQLAEDDELAKEMYDVLSQQQLAVQPAETSAAETTPAVSDGPLWDDPAAAQTSEEPVQTSEEPVAETATEQSAYEEPADSTEEAGYIEEAAPGMETATLEEAEQLWTEGNYVDAMQIFDALAQSEELTYDIESAEENDPEFEYAAICAMKSCIDNGAALDDFSNIHYYKYEPQMGTSFDSSADFDKDIIIFWKSYTEGFVCAYNRENKQYAFCSDDINTFYSPDTAAEDILSMARLKEIYQAIYPATEDAGTGAAASNPEEANPADQTPPKQ